MTEFVLVLLREIPLKKHSAVKRFVISPGAPKRIRERPQAAMKHCAEGAASPLTYGLGNRSAGCEGLCVRFGLRQLGKACLYKSFGKLQRKLHRMVA